MKRFRFIIISRKLLYFAASVTLVSVFTLAFFPPNILRPESARIVIDAGHGGVDGGTNQGGLLEKDVNLDIALKIKDLLEKKGYAGVLTRDADVSLDTLDDTGRTRHQRDLNARLKLIGQSGAQVFLSIHVNSNPKKPQTDGSIVFYGKKFPESQALARCIQRALNGVPAGSEGRTQYGPHIVKGFFLLNTAPLPGVIIETAFMSNDRERTLLAKDRFRAALAQAIADGTERYLKGSGVFEGE